MNPDRTILQERLLNIIKRFGQRRITVVGDAIADQFVYGAISRVSREAPVLILRHENTDTVPGGAANCAVNLASLGANVSLISVCGEDEPGRALIAKLSVAGVDCSGVITSAEVRTTTKVRMLAGHLHSTRQQVIRIDYDSQPLSDAQLREKLRNVVLGQSQHADAVVISDYGYGVADPELAGVLRDGAAARKLPVLADSRFSLTNFAGFTSATPNQDEVEKLLGKSFGGGRELEKAGEELRARLNYRSLLITRGGEGMLLLAEGAAPVRIEAVGAREPVDVTGAGDTVMAAYTLAIASDSSFSDAARLANYAGGLVVMKRGTASISAEELASSIVHSEI